MLACNLTLPSPCLFRVYKTVYFVQFVHFAAMYTTRLDIEVDLFRSQAGDFLALEVPNWMSLFIACG